MSWYLIDQICQSQAKNCTHKGQRGCRFHIRHFVTIGWSKRFHFSQNDKIARPAAPFFNDAQSQSEAVEYKNSFQPAQFVMSRRAHFDLLLSPSIRPRRSNPLCSQFPTRALGISITFSLIKPQATLFALPCSTCSRQKARRGWREKIKNKIDCRRFSRRRT